MEATINLKDISNIIYSCLCGNIFAVVLCVFVGVLLKLDLINTIYGSFQLFIVLQFTYLILFLRG